MPVVIIQRFERKQGKQHLFKQGMPVDSSHPLYYTLCSLLHISKVDSAEALCRFCLCTAKQACCYTSDPSSPHLQQYNFPCKPTSENSFCIVLRLTVCPILPLTAATGVQGNWLRSVGIKKGDAVAIYMPLVCELPIAMLACARIGAIHSVVFGGFSAEALAQRIQDCKARVVLTAAGTKRGAKKLGLKQIVDRAVGMTKEVGGFKVEVCLVLDTPSVAKGECPWVKGRDVWWQEQVGKQGADCKVCKALFASNAPQSCCIVLHIDSHLVKNPWLFIILLAIASCTSLGMLACNFCSGWWLDRHMYKN